MGTELTTKPQTKTAIAVVPGLLPQWLDAWDVTAPVPVPVEAVRQQIADIRSSLAPADPRSVAVALDKTIAVFEDNRPKNWDDIADTYFEAFEDVPVDLVEKACKYVRIHFKFKWPKPADFREAINEELQQRRHAFRRLQVAEMRAAPAQQIDDSPRATPEQIRAVSEMVKSAFQSVGHPEGDAKDHHRDEAVRTVLAEAADRRRIPLPGERRSA